MSELARDHAADRFLVVLGDLLSLQFCKYLASQVVHHLLADLVQQYFLYVREDEAKQKDAEKSEGEEPNTVEVLWLDKIIDGYLGKIRLCADKAVGEYRQEQGSSGELPVRPQIFQQALGYSQIIGFTYCRFFVILSNFF